MPVRRNLIAVAVLALTGATAAGGAAYAAGPGGGSPVATSHTSTTDPVCPVKKAGDPDKSRNAEQRIDAAAKALGVTGGQLTDAFTATKQWVGTTSDKPTAAVFAGHVASLLHKDAKQVQQALTAAGLLSDEPADVVVKDNRDEVNAHIAAAAKDLGVTTKQLDDALMATKMWVGTSSGKPTPEMFTQHVATLLGLSTSKVTDALAAENVFRADNVAKPAPSGPECKVTDKVQDKGITDAAKSLGITAAKLEDALRSAKQSLGADGTKPTPETFAARVATALGLPADKVLKALESAGMIGTDAPDKPGADAKDKAGADIKDKAGADK